MVSLIHMSQWRIICVSYGWFSTDTGVIAVFTAQEGEKDA